MQRRCCPASGAARPWHSAIHDPSATCAWQAEPACPDMRTHMCIGSQTPWKGLLAGYAWAAGLDHHHSCPCVPLRRQQLGDAWGQEWQGCVGSDCQTPSADQVLQPLVGSRGLLVLAPGRLLGHVGTQVRWKLAHGKRRGVSVNSAAPRPTRLSPLI